MSHLPVVPQSDFQRQLVERALALAQELERAAASAPYGRLLDRCELLLLDQGRQLLRDALAGALQQQIAQAIHRFIRQHKAAASPDERRQEERVDFIQRTWCLSDCTRLALMTM